MGTRRLPALGLEPGGCEKALAYLRQRAVLASGAKPTRVGDRVLLPLSRLLHPEELESLRGMGLAPTAAEHGFELREAPPRDLVTSLGGVLPSDLLSLVPRSFDILGDIAVLELPERLRPYARVVGEALMRVHRGVRLVASKTAPVSGAVRVARYDVLAGSGGFETLHREDGAVFKLDISKAFFTPRMATERMRVVKQVRSGEVVCDLFAGVGPFSILIARRVRDDVVYAVDVNPDAYRYLEENIRLNKVWGNVAPLLGDAREMARRVLKERCSRVVMNLPAEAEHYLEPASQTLVAGGGVIHLYIFHREREDLNERTEKAVRSLEALGWERVEVSETRFVRETGPRTHQVAIDIVLARKRGI